VVVRPGDSLWRIAQARLPSDADDAQVAAAVATLYAANRPVIGPDPDRLEPGQHLVFPDPPAHSEEP
jgi:nucleoid-associated protein YgaU